MPAVRLSQPVHFVGVSGIGMSALARVLRARGVAVSGCTDRENAITRRLAAEGIPVAIGHAAEHVDGVQTIVVSSALAADNPDVLAARERGVAVLHRGALLAELFAAARGIAVAGTHGKTTTTAMAAAMLAAGGLDPTFVVGGELLGPETNAGTGAGSWFVAESDESDGSFLALAPHIAVVTNVENDHVGSDAEFEQMVRSFASFLDSVAADGVAIVGIDEPRSAELARRTRSARTVTFGFGDADVCARDVTYARFGSRFSVQREGRRLGVATLGLPGAMNVQNALGAMTVALEAGVSFAAAAEALAAFRGVHRRFEVLARNARMTVVDDYAHHPTAVAATIAAARADWDGEIVVAFQPHRFTRTRYLAGDFARALHGADRVMLTDVYAASEAPEPGVDARTIGEPLQALGTDVEYVAQVADLPRRLFASVAPGSLVLCLGAGTITDAAHELAGLVRSGDAQDARRLAR
jgi:UDP-N-acetylmuramate--alanine ligase